MPIGAISFCFLFFIRKYNRISAMIPEIIQVTIQISTAKASSLKVAMLYWFTRAIACIFFISGEIRTVYLSYLNFPAVHIWISINFLFFNIFNKNQSGAVHSGWALKNTPDINHISATSWATEKLFTNFRGSTPSAFHWSTQIWPQVTLGRSTGCFCYLLSSKIENFENFTYFDPLEIIWQSTSQNII